MTTATTTLPLHLKRGKGVKEQYWAQGRVGRRICFCSNSDERVVLRVVRNTLSNWMQNTVTGEPRQRFFHGRFC